MVKTRLAIGIGLVMAAFGAVYVERTVIEPKKEVVAAPEPPSPNKMEPPHMFPPGPLGLSQLFNSRINYAMNGDADSMLVMAEVTDKCAFIGPFKSWEEYAESSPIVQSGQMPREMEDEFKARFDRLTPDCVYINSRMPSDTNYSQWAGDWYKKAAAAGSPAARLRMLWIEPESEDNRQSMALLLNDSFKVDDYRLDYLAAKFVVKYSDDDLEAAMWRYIGCTHDPECDSIEERHWLDIQYLPAQVDGILEEAKRIEQGKPINFVGVMP